VDDGGAIQSSIRLSPLHLTPATRHPPPATFHPPRRSAAPQREIGIRAAHSDAFTILEILGVLLLLSILITMLVSVVSVVQRKARQDRAQADANALVQAVLHYQQVYGAWPGAPTNNAPVFYVAGNTNLATTLAGIPPNTDLGAVIAALAPNNPGNPRQLLFLTMPTNALVNGLSDPWGQAYLLVMGAQQVQFPMPGISFSNLPAFAISAGAPVANPCPSSNWIFSAGVKP
jgi:type II secretory pathway pseudopilin PulG